MMSAEFPSDQNGDSREICIELDILKERINAQIEQYEEHGRRWDILQNPNEDAGNHSNSDEVYLYYNTIYNIILV